MSTTSTSTSTEYPVYVIGSNMSGYMPDSDNLHAVHVDPTGTDEDMNNDAVTSFVDELVRAIEHDADALQHDAETRVPGNDDVYVYALSDDELDDEISATSAILQSLESTTTVPGTIRGDIVAGVLAGITRGTGYTYMHTAPDGYNHSYFIEPCADERPVCSEFDEYDDCDHGCTAPDAAR